MPSWIESANLPACDFPIENLPYGVFKTETAKPAIGIAIGDFILDLRACAEVGLLSAGSLNTAAMRNVGHAPTLLSRGNLRDLYWTPAQMVTHHTSNGCNLLPGDLLGSGTTSGFRPDSLGCLLEITHDGTQLLVLPNGEQRCYLLDGDEVIFHALAQRSGLPRIGFGQAAGRVMQAP